MKQIKTEKVWYDLHIHSCLSSCGRSENTPNNILKQCEKNGLNLISITDHNTASHYDVIDKIKGNYNTNIIYGIEVSTNQEYHVLCYFENYEKLMNFSEFIKSNLDLEKQNEYNPQIIVDETGREVEVIDYKINQPVKCSYKTLAYKVRSLDGIIVLAHINRYHTGILHYHKDIRNFDFDAIEISKNGNLSLDMENIKKELYHMYPYLKNYKALYNSDGHSLDRIHKQIYYLDLEELNFKGLKKWLRD